MPIVDQSSLFASSVCMPAVTSDFRKIVQIAATAAAAMMVLSASKIPSRAQTGHMLVIPASDGYGFDDCLAGNRPCGRVIADAWCEAHGMAASVSFGRSDDVTASISTGDSRSNKVEPGSFIVNCSD